jgi:hypothetical protein
MCSRLVFVMFVVSALGCAIVAMMCGPRSGGRGAADVDVSRAARSASVVRAPDQQHVRREVIIDDTPLDLGGLVERTHSAF